MAYLDERISHPHVEGYARDSNARAVIVFRTDLGMEVGTLCFTRTFASFRLNVAPFHSWRHVHPPLHPPR